MRIAGRPFAVCQAEGIRYNETKKTGGFSRRWMLGSGGERLTKETGGRAAGDGTHGYLFYFWRRDLLWAASKAPARRIYHSGECRAPDLPADGTDVGVLPEGQRPWRRSGGGQYPLHDATLTAGVSSGGQQPHPGVPGPCQRLARLFCRMGQMYPPKSMKRFPGCVTAGSELTVPTGDDFMNKPLQQDAISQAIGKSY